MVVCVRCPVADIFEDGVIEEEVVLGDDADEAPQVLVVDGSEVVSINFDVSFDRVIESCQQVGDCRFPGACFSTI